MADSIASLGVPYLFVRGNHDATSATDTALLDRLSRIPNVGLLQRNPELYQKVSMAGVSFGGFNDQRFYGDDDPRVREGILLAINGVAAGLRNSG